MQDYFKEIFSLYYNKVSNLHFFMDDILLIYKKTINKNIEIYYYTLYKGSILLNYKIIINKSSNSVKIVEQQRNIIKIYRFENKKLHSKRNKPAIIEKTTNQEILSYHYYNKGLLHKVGKPAIKSNNREEYWILGKKYKKELALKLFTASLNAKHF